MTDINSIRLWIIFIVYFSILSVSNSNSLADQGNNNKPKPNSSGAISNKIENEQCEEAVSNTDKIDKNHEILIKNHPFIGNNKAKVIVVLFHHYLCPHCSTLDSFIQALLDHFNNQIMIVFKNYPPPTQIAFKAAAASLAAYRQGKFWEYHQRMHKIFIEKNKIEEDTLYDIAHEISLNMEQFAMDLFDPAIINIVKQDKEEGQKIGLKGVPTFFVNNKKAVNRPVVEFINEELKKQK